MVGTAFSAVENMLALELTLLPLVGVLVDPLLELAVMPKRSRPELWVLAHESFQDRRAQLQVLRSRDHVPVLNEKPSQLSIGRLGVLLVSHG